MSPTLDSRTRRLSVSGDLEPGELRDPSTQPTTLQLGSMLGRYVILRRVGEGGMGIVYEAHDPRLDRNVAVKVLWPARRTQRRIERLRQEARAMAKVSHPNVVQVFDVGALGDQVFLAMEFVRGRNLAVWLSESHRPVREILPVVTDVARGLAAAHAAGLVHRDVKPGNILVDEQGRARIGDFGLAHAAANTESSSAPGPRVEAIEPPDAIDAGLRPSGATGGGAGTPSHMAPEQHVGGSIDARADQFGLCVTLYQALFGELPFAGRDIHQLYVAKLGGTPRVPERTAVPPWLTAVCLRGLACDPAERFPSMNHLLDALAPPRPRRRWIWAPAAAAVATAAGIGVATMRAPTHCDDVHDDLRALWHDRRAELDVATAGVGAWLQPSWSVAQARIDAWTTTWTELRHRTCLANAGGVADELDATHACLRERKTALTTLLDLVEQGDAAVLRDVVAAVAALPSPTDCERAATEGREPGDLEARRRVQAMAESLARAETLGRAGRHADGLALADAALAQAEALDWDPLRAHADFVRGVMLRGLGEHEPAQDALERAHHLAQQLGDDALAVTTATQLTHLVGWDRGRVDDGERWARHGLAALHRGGDEPAAEAALLDAEGAALRRGGRYDEARTRLERARELWHGRPGQELRFASTLGQIAGLEVSVGRYDAARAAYARTLEIQTSVLGSEHPALATTLGGLGVVDHMVGDNDSAKPLLERAIALRERGLGPAHLQVAGPLNNLGIVMLRLGDHAAALTHHRRALTIRERTLGAEHPDVAESLNNIGVVLQEQGRYAEAEVAFVRALAIHDATLGPDHPNNVGLLDNIGIVARELHQYDKAERWHRRALALAERGLGADHVGTANALLGVAEALAATARCDQAMALLDRAEAIYVASGAEPSRRAEAMFARGRCRWELGEHAAGIGLARQAAAMFDALQAGGTRGRAAIDTWLERHAD